MKKGGVRRLPVVGFGRTVLGILSMNDILLAAGADKPVRSEEVVDTFQAICAHHHPIAHVVAA
jgi:CBS domain-containing protein